MSESPEKQQLDEAEREMEEAEKASAELRVHLQRAKDLVKTARKSIASAEQRTWGERSKG